MSLDYGFGKLTTILYIYRQNTSSQDAMISIFLNIVAKYKYCCCLAKQKQIIASV